MKKNSYDFECVLYYVAFGMFSVSKMLERSTLFQVSSFVLSFLLYTSVSLFLLKMILNKHKKRELLVCIILIAATIFFRMMANELTFLTISCLAFISIKDTDIKTIIRIDLWIKSAFLFIHSFFFSIDYLLGYESAVGSIITSIKGTSVPLYFSNPNTTGLVGLCIALDLLYLKRDKQFRDFVLPTIIVLVTFLLTTSRSIMFIYVLYISLQFIKNGKKLSVIQKLVYPVLFLLTYYAIIHVAPGSPIYETVNSLMSSRLRLSQLAYDLVGSTILPSLTSIYVLKGVILDVFYTKCIVEYGLVVAFVYYLPHFFLPLNATNEQKRMSIITSFYLLFESVVANIGIAIPYLILADAFFNRKRYYE